MNGKKSAKRPASGDGGSPGKARASNSGPMDVRLIEQIVQLMAANDLNTVDVRDGGRRIILKRGAPAPVVMGVGMAAAPAPAAPALPAANALAAQAAPAGALTCASSPADPRAPAGDEAGLIPIKSPMVGTFYSKPDPNSQPFVTVGSTVTDDTDVCLIEAMKTFNNVKAGCRGTIVRCLVQDGEVVQFDTVLYLVKPG